MKINENAPLIPPQSGVGKATPGSNSSAVNQSVAKATADVVPGPAVNLDISLTAKLAEVQSDSILHVTPLTRSPHYDRFCRHNAI